MAIKKRTYTVEMGDVTETVHVLEDVYTQSKIEVWPQFGFNCLRWQVPTLSGQPGDLLYCDPNWVQHPVPTRNGHPILFPFPNRLRDGRMQYRGQDYQLPLNESTGRHAIHGFTPKSPWQIIANSAPDTLIGEFELAKQRPDCIDAWPTNFLLRVEYIFKAKVLRVIATVTNLGEQPLPFGLGYHPYFVCPNAPGAFVEDMVLQTSAQAVWPLVGGLPTGDLLPLPAEEDFRTPRSIGAVEWDTLFGKLERDWDEADDDLTPIAWLGHREQPGVVSVWTDSAFEALLLFTPPHRQAVALEPYTCISDAANLVHEGLPVGWRELAPGDRWQATVEYRWAVHVNLIDR